MDTLPHDDRMERALIGCLLLEPERAYEVAHLPITAFYSTRHRVIFRAMADVLAARRACDLPILFNYLVETGKIGDAGEYGYIAELVTEHSWRAGNLKHYADIITDMATRRDAIVGAVETARIAREEGVEAVRAKLQELARSLDDKNEHPFRCLDVAAAGRGEIPDVPWLVEGWLGEGDATLFGGEWGTGKSLVALDLCVSLAAGVPWMERIHVSRPVPCLYLDEENNPVNATRRLGRLLMGREIDGSGLPLVYGSKNRIKLDNARGTATVERLIDQHGIRVLVLDSFIRFGRLNANKNDELAAFFDTAIAPMIGRYGVSVVMLDHMRKPGQDDDKSDIAHRITGGADKSGFADNVWVIHGKRDETSRTFEARKNRWEDTLPPPLTTKWEVSEDDKAARITASDATLNAETAVLVALMNAGPSGLYATEIFDECERRQVPRRSVIRAVKRMAQSGSITKETLPGRRVRYAQPFR